MKNESCNLGDKEKSCCCSSQQRQEVDLKNHWDQTYLNSPEENLGWYEVDLSPTLGLIAKTALPKTASLLNVGAGSSTLIDRLLELGYTHLIATDLSEVALHKLEERVGSGRVELIVDDLTDPVVLKDMEAVDLWIDRAVLHFFTEAEDQDTYFDLLKSKVKRGGFVLLAQYNLSGVEVCAGLPVQRYNQEMLAEKLGADFSLTEYFDHIYVTPSGAERPYVYTLFQRK